MWTNHTSFGDVFINGLDYCIMIDMTVFGKPGSIWCLPGETKGGKGSRRYRVLDVINED